MRIDINVTNTIDTVLGNVRDIVVVAKRNVAMSRGLLRQVHLLLRRALHAHAGSLLFGKQRLQPAYAATYSTAAAGPCRCERWAMPASHPSTPRHG